MKVLIITYYWPPSGGAGVQRWVKFAKYLPESGWEPVILTIDPEFAAYPVTDKSLLSEIPSELKVFKTRSTDYFALYNKDRSKIPSAGFAMNPDTTLKGRLLRFIRGNFFIPDPRKGWNRYAYKKAAELIRLYNISNVITTSPPHSTQLIGLKLKRNFPGINWIADMRDPWTDIYYYDHFYPTFISRWIDSGYETDVIKNADSLISVGPSLKKLFTKKSPQAESRITVIPNGYDEDDFRGSARNPGNFIITYTGTLSDNYPVDGFLSGLEKIREKDFILRFVGSVTPVQKKLILSKVQPEKLEFIPYVDHNAAVRYTRESSALLLIIPDHVSSKSILTGKLFEYLASGRPVICIGPKDGDASAIVEETGHGKSFGYNDSGSIGEYIEEISSSDINPVPAPVQYNRKELTGKLAKLLQ